MRNVRHLANLVGDRLQTLPLLLLYLTDGCNSRCISCDIWRNPRRNMAPELVDQLLEAVEELHIRWLLLSGGEAMQHPQWPQIAQRFRDKGVYVMLLTNGLLLRKQAQDAADSVDEVIVSLDAGSPASYEAIRGVDGFDLIMDGIRELRRRDVQVVTRATVQRANYRELGAIIAAARDADVNRISFLPVDVSSAEAFGPRFAPDPDLSLMNNPLGTALTLEDIDRFATILDEIEQTFAADFASGRIAESPAKLRRMLGYFRAVAGEGSFEAPRCNAPHISTVVEVDGSLRPCYFLPSYGTLNGAALGQAINGDLAQALRRAYRSGQRAECARCVCPLYKGPRALFNL